MLLGPVGCLTDSCLVAGRVTCFGSVGDAIEAAGEDAAT